MKQPPSALLFIASACPHCPTVLQALSDLIKSGDISQLNVFNLQHTPEEAAKYNVRSVPWLKIGPFELVGLRSKSEIKDWIKRIDDPDAMGDYFTELMTTGEMDKVQQIVAKSPETFSTLIHLIADSKTTLSARIGVGAIMEEFAGQQILKDNIEPLAELTKHKEALVRNDVCFYLGLSRDKKAKPFIEALLNDENDEVKEVAAEALEELDVSLTR